MNTELVNIKINHFLLRLYWCCVKACVCVHQQNCVVNTGMRTAHRAVRLSLSFSRLAHTQHWEGTTQITPPTHSSSYLPDWLLLP